jgi:hypothetical protein
MTDIERLKGTSLAESRDASDAVQLLHLMLRAGRWAEYEQPSNFPLWRPEDVPYYFGHFFEKVVEPERIETAFLELQKAGLVEKTDGGYVLAEKA